MSINLQDGLVYWIIPAVLAITAIILLLWWIILLIAPAPRARAEAPRYTAPPNGGRQESQQSQQQRQAYVPPAIPSDYRTQIETNAKMVVTMGLNGGEISLPGGSFSIGRFRDEANNILVAMDDTSISRRHAQMRYDPGQRTYFIKDIGSTYGTFRLENGQAHQLTTNVEEPVYNGDMIQFGQNVQVRFVLPGEKRDERTRV